MKLSFSPTLTASLAAVALIGTTVQVQVQALEDIPTTAIENGSFTTLVAALGAADLVDALSEPNGPFTVFAPTDEAFDALPNGLVECLLEPENKDSLAAILTYHVVSGQVLSSDLMDGMTATTLQGEDVTVDLSDGVKINDSIVVAADVSATNGVIHVISSVLVPPSLDVEAFLETCDIPSTAIEAGMFNTLVAALGAADLVGALQGDGPFTVFAPTDDAFAALPEELVTCLLEPDNKGVLQSILTYHVVSGQVLSTDLEDGMEAATLQGEEVVVDLSDGVKINESNVIIADVLATNGVIHVIDAVLVPPS
ncbi:Fasciclin-domain-containing protein, partial [Fragilariopsis cylindrus CCMP1102]